MHRYVKWTSTVVMMAFIFGGLTVKHASALTVQVYVDDVFLTSIMPIIDAGTGFDFYEGDNDDLPSPPVTTFTGKAPFQYADLVAGTAHLFVVEGSDGLSLGVVYKGDGSNAGTADVRIVLTGGSAADIVVEDGPADTYTENDATLEYTASHGFQDTGVDGLVLTAPFVPGRGIFIDFTNVTSLTSLGIFDASTPGLTTVTGGLTNQVKLITVVPLPIAGWVAAPLLGVLALVRYARRQRSA